MKNNNMIFKGLFLWLMLLSMSCDGQTKNTSILADKTKSTSKFDTLTKTIHIFVALCDNKYQGIVPVPSAIGNGQDPNSNLYWGCANGIRTYFKKSKEWKFIKGEKLDAIRMERLLFKHVSKNYYLVADAYDGRYIKQTTIDFLNSCAGRTKEIIKVNQTTIGINGNAKMLAYIGHDGLMDFNLTDTFASIDGKRRDAIILACISKKYFAAHLLSTKAIPVLWTTGLMCPEAYTLHDALSSYVAGANNKEVRAKAALAYNRFQKCGIKASRNLLVSGY
jgi:hypothetical protein